MREYQRKTGKYILPGNVYMQTIYQIRDYNRLKEEADRILEESKAPPDGQPKQSGASSDIERKVVRRDKLLHIVDTIDRAIELLPEEYRQGVWDNVMDHKAFPKDADRRTYGRYKSLFVFTVAKDLYLFE